MLLLFGPRRTSLGLSTVVAKAFAELQQLESDKASPMSWHKWITLKILADCDPIFATQNKLVEEAQQAVQHAKAGLEDIDRLHLERVWQLRWEKEDLKETVAELKQEVKNAKRHRQG